MCISGRESWYSLLRCKCVAIDVEVEPPSRRSTAPRKLGIACVPGCYGVICFAIGCFSFSFCD